MNKNDRKAVFFLIRDGFKFESRVYLKSDNSILQNKI